MGEVWIAFGLTVFAGMATAIGGIIAFTASRTNYRFLSVATGFSAGVMLYVSFVEIFLKGVEAALGAIRRLLGPVDKRRVLPWRHVADRPDRQPDPGGREPPRDPRGSGDQTAAQSRAPLPDFESVADASPAAEGLHDHTDHHHKLMRMGLFTALAIGIHNFPEGLATFLAALHDPSVGLAIAVAMRYTTSPKASACRFRSSTPRETARRPSAIRY